MNREPFGCSMASPTLANTRWQIRKVPLFSVVVKIHQGQAVCFIICDRNIQQKQPRWSIGGDLSLINILSHALRDRKVTHHGTDQAGVRQPLASYLLHILCPKGQDSR